MTAWTTRELDTIGAADELQIASVRPDGTLRPFVTIWAVRAGDELYVRSAYGATNPWFVRALASGTGRIRAGGVERDVTFERAAADVHAAIDAAYHAKYDRYGQRIVGSVTGPDVVETTIRLVPRDYFATAPRHSSDSSAHRPYGSRTPTRSSPSQAARASISASTDSATSVVKGSNGTSW
jgi:hypothetical protein